MCPHSRRWPSLCIVEYERTSWLHSLLSGLQRTKAKAPPTAYRKERHCVPPRSARKSFFVFLQALQVQHTQFRMFGTFIPKNVNAGGSAVLIRKNLLSENVVVTHEITCQGRDHIVRIRSDESVLEVTSVHFEPDLIFERPS